ncbi:MAG: class I SAM-dependent methyltransferase [Sedimentisphaerales bacterium]|nr:class I SAM-dependent methyltransferase [Sedimentisphaerales bacterium]
MGDINQLTFIKEHLDKFSGPFLEVGSKDYGTTQDLRSLFKSKAEYTGLDMEAGQGVDIVLDLTNDFKKIDSELGNKRFGTIFCLSVLEHCDNPFKMAENLAILLKPGGMICIGVPFSWQIHGYPNDYWRFTPEGVKKLFPSVKFDMDKSTAATSKVNDFKNIDDDLGKISFSYSKHKKNGHTMRGISAKFLKMLSKIGIFTWLTGYRHLFAPTGFIMIGKLEESKT